MSGSLVVVGSVAIDTLETPRGRAPDVLGGAATYFAVAASFAQSYPQKPIRLLVGFTPGGAADSSARALTAHSLAAPSRSRSRGD